MIWVDRVGISKSLKLEIHVIDCASVSNKLVILKYFTTFLNIYLDSCNWKAYKFDKKRFSNKNSAWAIDNKKLR